MHFAFGLETEKGQWLQHVNQPVDATTFALAHALDPSHDEFESSKQHKLASKCRKGQKR